MEAYKYPNVGRSGRFCKGHYAICQFGYHYLVCRPEDKPDDPLLKASLKEFLVSSTYGEQFLRNLHPWKNKENIIDQIFHYLAHDDYQHSTQSLAKSIKWIAHELFIGNLLIIPLSEPKEIYTSYKS